MAASATIPAAPPIQELTDAGTTRRQEAERAQTGTSRQEAIAGYGSSAGASLCAARRPRRRAGTRAQPLSRRPRAKDGIDRGTPPRAHRPARRGAPPRRRDRQALGARARPWRGRPGADGSQHRRQAGAHRDAGGATGRTGRRDRRPAQHGCQAVSRGHGTGRRQALCRPQEGARDQARQRLGQAQVEVAARWNHPAAPGSLRQSGTGASALAAILNPWQSTSASARCRPGTAVR
jgi:hypothetical protein